MARSSVDLPEPLTPISAIASPSRATKETSRTAWISRIPRLPALRCSSRFGLVSRLPVASTL